MQNFSFLASKLREEFDVAMDGPHFFHADCGRAINVVIFLTSLEDQF